MKININQRQGQMQHLQSYFYTDTINGFKNLLLSDEMKLVVIDSLKYLVQAKKVKIWLCNYA